VKVLDKKQIQQKIARIAMEILEQNYTQKELVFAGINNAGRHFAGMLQTEIERVSEVKVHLTSINLSPAKPVLNEITIDFPRKELKSKVIIIVDDVGNTGRTLFYAFQPLLEILPKKVQVAVLVDRKHKSFPVAVDYVGLSLATTLRENIKVILKGKDEEIGVYLD